LYLTVLPYILFDDFGAHPALPGLFECALTAKIVKSTIVLRPFSFCVVSRLLNFVLVCG
jgi:hypothetical protein